MMQFMQGRYGADQMGQMLSAVSMVFLIISLFSRNQAWFLLAVIGIVYNYFRMFSKNISKRYAFAGGAFHRLVIQRRKKQRNKRHVVA